MKKWRFHRLAPAALLALVWACSTSPSARFYTLSDGSPGENPEITAAATVLLVGPVELADYLDRPQMVVRTGPHELRAQEFHRWAGSFRQEASRILIGALGEALAPFAVRVQAWTPGRAEGPLRGRVALDLGRVDGPLGGEVVVEMDWTLMDGSGRAVDRGRLSAGERARGASHAEYAAAVAEALRKAAVELALRVADGGQEGP
jgi:uncharacterized lipoprotein YmbA